VASLTQRREDDSPARMATPKADSKMETQIQNT